MNDNKSFGCLSYITMFVSLLTTVFIVLKLTGIVDWGWVWVLAPIWIFAGGFVFLVVFLCIITLLFAGNQGNKQ